MSCKRTFFCFKYTLAFAFITLYLVCARFTLGSFTETLCGFMGVWDSGPFYDVVEITEDRLVLHGPIQGGDCIQAEGWFTITFVAE